MLSTYSFNKVSGTTAYEANDLVANHATAGSVVPMSFAVRNQANGIIRAARLFKSSTTTTDATFTLHLFESLPTPGNGDNGAFALASAVGYLDGVALDLSSGAIVGTAGAYKRAGGLAICFQLPTITSRLYGLLQVMDTYTPASSELFTITLEIEGD